MLQVAPGLAGRPIIPACGRVRRLAGGGVRQRRGRAILDEDVQRRHPVGRKEIEALVRILQEQLRAGQDGVVVGTWQIVYSRDHEAFLFEKCELGAYCEERPSVISVAGKVLDRGGPLLGD